MKLIIIAVALFAHNLTTLALSKSSPGDSSSVIVTLEADAFYGLMQAFDHPIILDARDIRTFSKYKIKGSIHVPNKKALHAVVDTMDRDEPVFVYCEVGFSSKLASRELEKEGFLTIYNLEKGIRNWKKDGFPVVRIKRHEQKKNE